MPESRVDKALRAVREGRVRIERANSDGIAIRCRSEHPEPSTLEDREYRAMVYLVPLAGIVRRCDCTAAQARPNKPACWHLTLCELLWRPNRCTE